jgi:carboxyl-terminal processing protease
LKLTTADYWRPSGHNIHRRPGAKETDEWGVSPDEGMDVKMTENEFQKWVAWRREQDRMRPGIGEEKKQAGTQEAADFSNDPVLMKGVEELKGEIKGGIRD